MINKTDLISDIKMLTLPETQIRAHFAAASASNDGSASQMSTSQANLQTVSECF